MYIGDPVTNPGHGEQPHPGTATATARADTPRTPAHQTRKPGSRPNRASRDPNTATGSNSRTPSPTWRARQRTKADLATPGRYPSILTHAGRASCHPCLLTGRSTVRGLSDRPKCGLHMVQICGDPNWTTNAWQPVADGLTSVEEAQTRLTSGEERWKLGKCGKVWRVVNALLNTPVPVWATGQGLSNSGLGWATGQAYIKGLCLNRRRYYDYR
jgi:hypothetical protein